MTLKWATDGLGNSQPKEYYLKLRDSVPPDPIVPALRQSLTLIANRAEEARRNAVGRSTSGLMVYAVDVPPYRDFYPQILWAIDDYDNELVLWIGPRRFST